MGKLYVRIDDRLIHGQIVTAWAQALGIQRIMAIDNGIASNPMMKSLATMGVPSSIASRVFTEEEAMTKLDNFSKNTLVIVRYARNLNLFLDKIKNAEFINIGNCAKQNDAAYTSSGFGVGNTISLTEADYNALETLDKMQVPIISQMVPTERKTTWEELKKTFR